jgi:hypothetical protein
MADISIHEYPCKISIFGGKVSVFLNIELCRVYLYTRVVWLVLHNHASGPAKGYSY